MILVIPISHHLIKTNTNVDKDNTCLSCKPHQIVLQNLRHSNTRQLNYRMKHMMYYEKMPLDAFAYVKLDEKGI